MDGIINLDKAGGISSARAADGVKRLLPRGMKIGHAGTLDPFATGVLLLLIGRATKLCETLMDQRKTYDATVKLGAVTETDDPESPEQPYPSSIGEAIERETIESLLPSFTGLIQQRPPAFSAMKIAGRRAYELARRGREVELEARPVRVYAIDLLRYEWPLLRLRIECGRGTYIRSIARDLGEALKVGGYLTQLRRTRIGSYDVTNAVKIEQLLADGVEKHFIPFHEPRP